MTFSALGLEQGLLEAVEGLGYEHPTPIQAQAIPPALAGRDIVGCAQTGTGKTLAFILPALQRMPKDRALKTLVVTPTRELAGQIEDVARSAARRTGHKILAVYGGVGYEPQVAKLRKGVDLLVATPGRLLDLHRRHDVDLSRVELFVLDEADRMLDMGFWPDVRRIMAVLPVKRQNMLFSATMSRDVVRASSQALTEPLRIDVAPSATPVEEVTQVVYPVNGLQKTDLLLRLLAEENLDKVLVFTRTKHRADRLCRELHRKGVGVGAIHSNRTQAQRQRALDDFRDGKTRVLVATDIVARGIDVEAISHVVNYDLPSNPEDYIHRIGRTARAGARGTAASLMGIDELKGLRDIEHLIGTTLPCKDVEGFDYLDRVVPNEARPAKRPPRLVYNGHARRRSPGRFGRR